MVEKISLKWWHGLGDTANFAHLIKLWTTRGYKVEVACTVDKAPLIESAGCEWAGAAQRQHHWPHAPNTGNPDHDNHFLNNKTAWNLDNGVLPNIGTKKELWEELKNIKLKIKQPSKNSKKEIDEWLNKIDGPKIILHTRGNTGQESKNFSSNLETDLYKKILDKTNATIILLDYDQRVQKLNSYRIRHLEDDFKKLELPELGYLFDKCDLLVGVDSGPLHFSRFTKIPTLGIWFKHYPSIFALPCSKTAHIVARSNYNHDWNKYRRFEFNILENPNASQDADFIVQQIQKVLAGKIGSELVIDSLIDKCRYAGGHLSDYVDRDKSFRICVDFLKNKKNPTVVETGSIRSLEDYSAGYFGYIFSHFLKSKNGKIYTCEIDEQKLNFAKEWMNKETSNFVLGDSVSSIYNLENESVDLLYLDSKDVGVPGFAEHCLAEVNAGFSKLKKDHLILIDDTVFSKNKWTGKGETAVPFLLNNNYKILYSGYQTLLKNGNL